MKLHFAIIIVIIFLITELAITELAFSQRWMHVYDSTDYVINNTDTLVAGRFKLYKKENGNLNLIKDFYSAAYPDHFIKDFDFVNENEWYTLHGSRYFGYENFLYKTTDAGATWKFDSSYCPASTRRSLNQMQIVDSNRFFLFDGYYTSYVLRTFDGGKSWENWFGGYFSNHFGIFICNDTTYYQWGILGDGFSAYMYRIPYSLFDTSNYFPIFCTAAPECYRAPGVIYHVDSHFIPIFNNLCNNITSISTEATAAEYELNIFPNPAMDILNIDAGDSQRGSLIYWQICDVLGRIHLKGNSNKADVSSLPKGIYFLILPGKPEFTPHKFLKK